MTPDLINSLFELCAGFFVLNHARVLYKEKMVHGISIISVLFFVLWGFWNLFYYPHLGQTLSYYAGMFICFTNITWIVMLVKYKYFHKPVEP